MSNGGSVDLETVRRVYFEGAGFVIVGELDLKGGPGDDGAGWDEAGGVRLGGG